MVSDPPANVSPTTSAWRSFRRLLTFWGPFKRQVGASIVLAFVIVAARLVIPFMTGRVIDDIRRHSYDAISHDVLLLLGAALVMAIVSASRRVVAGSISLGIEKVLRDRLFSHLTGLSFRFFDRQQTGQLLSRVTSDVTMVRFFLGYGLLYFFMHAATLIGVPVMLWITAPRLAPVVFVMMPIIFIISVRYSRLSHPILREVQQRVADVTAHGEENIVGSRVVRAFGQEAREVRRFRQLTGEVVSQERRAMLVDMRYKPLFTLIPNVTLAVVVLVASRLITAHDMTLGDFFAFYGYMLQLTGPLRIIGNLLGRAQRAVASSSRLWELLDADDRLPQPHPATPLAPTPHAGSGIRFEHVSFGYRDGHRVLDDVSLNIAPGETIAILGPTGCGKTTLAALIPRFYDAEHGRVLIDGIDVRELDLQQLRRTIGIVDQEPFLFSATIADNLRYGNPDATDDALLAAIDAAQAREFVDRLPNGIETMIGERGLTLSGGQRQRLSIARALVVDPSVLILDDATASIDSQVEQRISHALHSATERRTTIIIAHRPSTIALAERVVVMREGRIDDVGTHDELMQRNATYQLVHEQRSERREFLLDPNDETDQRGDMIEQGRP